MPMHPSPRGKTSGPEAPNLIADRSFIMAPSGRRSAAASIRRSGSDRQHPGLTFAALGRDPLGPLDRLFPGLDPDDPVAGDQLLGLGERPVDHRLLAAAEPDPHAGGDRQRSTFFYTLSIRSPPLRRRGRRTWR